MPTDLQTFALAFTLVWLGLAAYLLRLHALARRLEARMKKPDRPS
jgi:CcmD family protein